MTPQKQIEPFGNATVLDKPAVTWLLDDNVVQ